jgi:hypothetical protein
MSRKIIDKVEYLKTQAALQKLLEKTPTLELVPGTHNVNIIPEGLNIHYISKEYMNDFKPFAKYDIRTHKLVNYGTPAVELNFYYKHKYFVDTKQTMQSIEQHLMTYLDNLADEKFDLKVKIKQIIEELSETTEPAERESILETYKAEMMNLQEQTDYWTNLARNLSKMEWVISNYELGFHYYELGFKYWDNKELEYVIYNSHMVKNQFNKKGELIQERHNLIFVDEQALQRPVPNQHKTVEKLLSTFTSQFRLGVKMLYFKEKKS